MLFCDECKTDNLDTARFCRQCGRSTRFALRLHNVGTMVRHYRIVRVIGCGGFGAVYAAEDTRTPKSRVALKESFDPSGMQQLQHEFDVLRQLQHPHLPRYDALFEEHGIGYLVMEFIPGQSLDEILAAEGAPLLEAVVKGFALQLCDALEYLHAQNPPIIHRDIKPANIRLTPSGRIKLVDFGLFKQGTQATRNSIRGYGTEMYAPFEQYGSGNQHTDERSDIYSLGATIYHLLTGQKPVESVARIAVSPDPLVVPERVNPRLSPEVSAVIRTAMSLKAEDRFADVAAFRMGMMGGAKGVVSVAPIVPSMPLVPSVPSFVIPPTLVPKLIHIPAGPFQMGSDTGGSDEKPRHTLILPDYWMSETLVTNAQFRPFVEGDGYTNAAYWTPDGWTWRQAQKRQQPGYWTEAKWNGADYPVVGVAWYEAAAYAAWLSAQTNQTFRLPTEAEWEKAARGTDGRVYPWGDTWELGRCNSEEAKVGKTTPVGKYPTGASPYGLLDMAGNVWEWTYSEYRSYPYLPNDGREAIHNMAQKHFTLRGGSWSARPFFLRTSNRNLDTPSTDRNNAGFRISRRTV